MSTAVDFHPEESPIAWFVLLLRSIDDGDFALAAEAQRQLERLGWSVHRRRQPRQKPAGEGGGR